MKSSEGGLPVSGVRLGAVRAPVYENKDRDDLLLMAFDEGSVGACVTTANQFCAAPRAYFESAFGIDCSCSLLATQRRQRKCWNRRAWDGRVSSNHRFISGIYGNFK